MRSSSKKSSARPTSAPGLIASNCITSAPSRSGRIFESSSCSISTSMRASRLSYVAAKRAALRAFRVVQSARVSTCRCVSNSPASRTYLRTAESVHSPSPYPWKRRCNAISVSTSSIISLLNRSAFSLFFARRAPTTSW